MTWSELSLRLCNWFEEIDQPVTLATDSLEWDWPWIEKIFAEPGTWPANLARQAKIVIFDEFDEKYNDALVQAFSEGLRLHHSLDDAKGNLIGWIATGGDEEREAYKQ